MITNKWVGYITRSYQQIKANVLAGITSVLPEMTDHTETNPFVAILDVWAGITEQLGYYIDNAAREALLITARLFKSAALHADSYDYRIRGIIPASVNLTFYFDTPVPSNVTIPAGTEVRTAQGVPFYTTTTVVILATTTQITVGAIQKVPVVGAAIGTSDGLINQKFPIAANIVDNSISVLVNITPYTPVETFAYYTDTDTVFVAGLNRNGLMELRFGDNINGIVPPVGNAITATYYTSVGSVGNVGANTITNIIPAIAVPIGFILKCTNSIKASGGVDAEDLETIRKNVPLMVRTLLRAVTYSDYKYIALLAGGVAKAGVFFKCGKTVDVYIAPVGGGIAPAPLLASVLAFFEDKRMVTTLVRVLPAGEVGMRLVINRLQVDPSYDRLAVEAAVTTNLVNFLSVATQDIGGTVHYSDLVEIIENTPGVLWSELDALTVVPYARPVNTSNVLNWTREINPTSTTTVRWEIKILPGLATYQLYNYSLPNPYVGTFAVGVLVSMTELNFTVNAGTYANGDTFEFYTYKYSGTLVLEEQSIPVASPTDIIITSFGGI